MNNHIQHEPHNVRHNKVHGWCSPYQLRSWTPCSQRATSVEHHTLLSSEQRRERGESCSPNRLHSGRPGYTSCTHSWRQGVKRYIGSTAVAKDMVVCSSSYSRHCAVFTKVSDMQTQWVSSLEQSNLVSLGLWRTVWKCKRERRILRERETAVGINPALLVLCSLS